MPDSPGLWSGDVNDVAREEWRRSTSALERVTSVITTTTAPASASAIAERALVSEETATHHLEYLVEIGQATTVSVDGDPAYRRSPLANAMRHIELIHDQSTNADLEDGIESLRERLAARRAELEATPDEGALATRVQELERNLAIAMAAFHLYDYARLEGDQVDPDRRRDG